MKKKKILIIDDNVNVCSGLGKLLEGIGYQVFQGIGGAKGLQIATEKHPDLILLDRFMPDITGYEVLIKLRERNIPTRIIVFTGFIPDIPDIVKYIKAGACDFILKGNDDKLIHIIERNLALENTLNLQVSNPAPIIEETLAKANKLSVENEELKGKVTDLEKKLSHRPILISSAINLTLLIACISITLLFCYITSINDFWVKVLLPVGFFTILKFPMDKLSKIFVKLPTTEANIELQSSENNQKQLPK